MSCPWRMCLDKGWSPASASYGHTVEGERVREPVVVADLKRGLLPGLNEDVLLAEQLQVRFELLLNHASAAQHLDQFRDHLQLVFVRAGEHDRLEVRVDGLEGDLLVAPGVALYRLLALVALDGVALSGLRVDGVAKLDQDSLALARALDRRAKEAPGAIGNSGLHGFAQNLGDEHARA